MAFNIAIDGPAGAGKSTIAKQIAKKLSFLYVDTGAMYRSIALYMMRNQVDIYNEEAVSLVCDNIHIGIQYEGEEQQVYLNDENVTSFIRAEEVGVVASVVSAYTKVRETLLKLQQTLAHSNNVIMDGRDIGTCVLPNADFKFFVTATEQVRAQRRYDQLKNKKDAPIFEQILEDLRQRDYNDEHRKIAPLKPAKDSIILDTSNMTLDQTVKYCCQIIKSAQK